MEGHLKNTSHQCPAKITTLIFPFYLSVTNSELENAQLYCTDFHSFLCSTKNVLFSYQKIFFNIYNLDAFYVSWTPQILQ